MAAISVNVGSRADRTRVGGDDWRETAACHFRSRYGEDAEAFHGDRTYSSIIIGHGPTLGGRLEVYGKAKYVAEERQIGRNADANLRRMRGRDEVSGEGPG